MLRCFQYHGGEDIKHAPLLFSYRLFGYVLPPPLSPAQAVAALGCPVTPRLDPEVLGRMNPAAALATTFLNLRQNVMQFRFALSKFFFFLFFFFFCAVCCPSKK